MLIVQSFSTNFQLNCLKMVLNWPKLQFFKRNSDVSCDFLIENHAQYPSGAIILQESAKN